jgi:hypothetical protein
MGGGMVKDEEPTIHGPFGRFRVTTEPMSDGRQIHYYEWPADGEAGAAEGAESDGSSDDDE